MASRDRRNIKFSKLIAKGENPLGMTAQTANGTAHHTGTGWNDRGRDRMPRDQVAEGGAWGGKNSTRTGA